MAPIGWTQAGRSICGLLTCGATGHARNIVRSTGRRQARSCSVVVLWASQIAAYIWRQGCAHEWIWIACMVERCHDGDAHDSIGVPVAAVFRAARRLEQLSCAS